jgi:glycosyltransferase involved in cell wall biosynthesis
MRVLYLLNFRQDSITDSSFPKINLPWVDALLDRLVQSGSVEIALAVPVNGHSIQKSHQRGITIYGMPSPKDKNLITKAYKRFTRAGENCKINSYIPNLIDDFKPDVIQIFGSENCFGLIVKDIKTPVVIHIQGFLFVLKRKWFTGISKWEQFSFASLKDLLLMRGFYNDSFTFGVKADTSATIIQNCKYFMGRTNFDRVIVSLISPESKYYHCEEFIRKEFFEKEWAFPLHDKVECVSILKGASYKGIDLLVETYLVLKQHSDRSFKFKICGVSPKEEIVKIIKKKYKKVLNWSDIEFLGKLSAAEIVDQLCASNIYVHPSYMENSPNSVCEAMALGMPVIATNVGGTSSILDDGVEGILVQEGEPYSMAAAIVNLSDNYENAIKLGANAKRKAIKRHEPNGIVRSLMEIYDDIANGNGK